MKLRHQRILHVDGDSFFASCEIALAPQLINRPVFVGGGRRGDGIVIAANYIAKRYGIETGMACFEARRRCPEGVLVPPHYDEYRRLSLLMFKCLRQYTPLLVPTSIDEGFLEFTDSPRVFACANAAELVARMKRHIAEEAGVPVSAGLASSRWLAKLATEQNKPNGFCEVPEEHEREFLAPIPVQKLVGIGDNRARTLRAFMVKTLGDVASVPLEVLRKRLGVFGEQLWLLARGELHEQLTLANKPRTTISSATTLPYDEPDYEAALLFLLDQAERALTTIFRENLKAREMGVFVRFRDLDGMGRTVRFPAAQFDPRIIGPEIERLFWKLVAGKIQPVRQVAIHFWNLEPLDLHPNLFEDPPEIKLHTLHRALEQIESRFGPRSIKTGTRLLLETTAPHLLGDKPKCPYLSQREMESKVSRLPETNREQTLDPVEESIWQPPAEEPQDVPLLLPRSWGRSTNRPKFPEPDAARPKPNRSAQELTPMVSTVTEKALAALKEIRNSRKPPRP